MTRAGAVLVRGLALGGLWWILAEGRSPGWYYGLAAVAVALTASLHVAPPTRAQRRSPARAGAAVLLAVWFTGRSLHAGIDVSRRILAPSTTVTPKLQRCPLLLPPGPLRHIALIMANLMPGSLIVALEDDTAVFHVLDARLDPTRDWTELQRRIAAVAGRPPQAEEQPKRNPK